MRIVTFPCPNFQPLLQVQTACLYVIRNQLLQGNLKWNMVKKTALCIYNIQIFILVAMFGC